MSKKSKQKMASRKKKQQQSKTSTTTTVVPTKNKPKQKQKPAPDSNWQSISSKIKSSVIEVPSELTSKEAKKFRKDKRRESRAKGEAEPTFVCANASTAATTTAAEEKSSKAEESNRLKQLGGKRKRAAIPNIKELLEKERESAKLEAEKRERENEEAKLSPEECAKYLALDCEMVGIGSDGKRSALARVSIIGWDGEVLLDKFVKVPDRVSDFRTWVSGVRAKDLKRDDAITPEECRTIVGNMFMGKTLVGHSIKNDLEALMLTHPRNDIRDTARYKPFMKARGKDGGKLRPRKLKELAEEYLGLMIQVEGESHCSIDDARATMQLFRHVRSEWDLDIASKRKKGGKP